MRFLIDRCVGRRLANWLRTQGHDVVELSTKEPDPGDRAILTRAESEKRILVTMDKDFGRFVFAEAATHVGLVRLPDVPAVRRMDLFSIILERHQADLAAGKIVTVQEGRVRISTSPKVSP